MPQLVSVGRLMNGRRRLTPDDHSSTIVYADYTTGRAAVSNGGYFAIAYPTSATKFVYLKTAGAGVLIGIFPNDNQAAYTSAANAMRAITDVVTPDIDINSMEAYFGIRNIQSRAPSAPTRTLNLLGDDYGVDYDLSTQGGVTLTPRIADSAGGVSANRVQLTDSSNGSFLFTTLPACPPGQWQFQFETKIHSGGTNPQSFETSSDFAGASTVKTLTSDTAWVTITSPAFELTAAAARTPRLVGQITSDGNKDIDIQGLRLMPGAAATTNDVTATPSPALPIDLTPVLSGKLFHSVDEASSSLNFMRQGFRSEQNLVGWTLSILGNSVAPPSTLGIYFQTLSATGSVGSYIFEQAVTDNSQALKGVALSAEAGTPGISMLAAGAIILTIREDSGTITTFINGIKIGSRTLGSAAITSMVCASFGAFGRLGTAFRALGDYNAYQFFASALSDNQVASQATVMRNRYTALGLSLAAQNVNLLLSEGDSISRWSVDTTNIGWNMRPLSLMSGARIQGFTYAETGSTLTGGNSLTARQAADLAEVSRLLAAGFTNIIFTVLVGTNDAATITTQAIADSYYSTLIAYVATFRAAGCKVALGTQIPQDRDASTYAYDRTPVVIVTGPCPGAYNGLRNYIRALILNTPSAVDGIIDFGGLAEFSSYNATYFADTVHPNNLGHSVMATCAKTVYEALRV